jgi:uncharacterized protein YlxW (UPF0749 family)
MRRSRSQLAITIVAFVLGFLVVAQLRVQQTAPALAGVSAQDLTVLVGNLNTRNDQLRTEIATLDDELGELRGNQARGETSLDDLRRDLADVRAFAGLESVAGPGVAVAVDGPISAGSVSELLNELRASGAEAIAINDVRIVPGSVVSGPPGALSVEQVSLGTPFEIRAIGAPETLTGSLTRSGGIVSQLAAVESDATLTVTPLERTLLPPARRDLVPTHGRPSL